MTVTVHPEEFTFVRYDAGEIAALVDDLAAQLDLRDHEIVLEVNERSPLGTAELRSLEPIGLFVDSGALEHPKAPRTLSTEGTVDVLGRLLLEARDRMDPTFGAPALGEPLPLRHRVAWDTYCMGRLAALGHRSQTQRRRYHFRARHGFTDHADAAFDRLWTSPDLTWAEVTEISDTAVLPRS